jgi:hypothetical protein
MVQRSLWLFAFSLLLSFPSFSRQTQQSRATVSVLNSISVGARFSFYGPKVDNLNTAFGALEDTIGLNRAPDFKFFSLGSANIRYQITPQHSVSVEGGMSLWKSKLPHAESTERVYTIGAQYYYSLQNRQMSFFGVDAGVGAGWLVVNFERNYDTQRISVLKNSVTANASVVGWVSPFSPFYLELEARYMFVPNINVTYPHSTVKMSSVVVGAGISVLL